MKWLHPSTITLARVVMESTILVGPSFNLIKISPFISLIVCFVARERI